MSYKKQLAFNTNVSESTLEDIFCDIYRDFDYELAAECPVAADKTYYSVGKHGEICKTVEEGTALDRENFLRNNYFYTEEALKKSRRYKSFQQD